MKLTPNYQVWQVDELEFPKDSSLEQQITFLLNYGVLAPSTHNCQPWTFRLQNNALHISLNTAINLAEADPIGRHRCISLGACAYNIEVAAAYFGFNTKYNYQGTNYKNATITIKFNKSSKKNDDLAQLFPQITRRHSEKRIIKSDLNSIDLRNYTKLPNFLGQVNFTQEKGNINILARLCYEAASSYATKPRFANELSRWLRDNNTMLFDGMPGFSNGLSQTQLVIGRLILRYTAKILKPMSKKYSKMIRTSPAVGIITTNEDDWRAWLAAGRAYEHLSLSTTADNISLCPMAALIEHPVRKNLNKAFADTQGYPQLFFRVVHTNQSYQPTPRRSVNHSLAEQAIIDKLKQTGIEITSHTIEIDTYQIHYVRAGIGEPLVLLHGMNVGWGMWQPNLSELAKHYQVIAIDLLGCGGSSFLDFRQFNIDKQVAILIQLFQKLGLSAVNLIGHSLAAIIAVKLAVDKQLIKKLILVQPMGFSRRLPGKQKLISFYPIAKFLSRTIIPPTRGALRELLVESMVKKGVLTLEFVNYYWASIQNNPLNHPLLFMNSFTRYGRLRPELKVSTEFYQLNQTTLVIIGDKDTTVPFKHQKQIAMRPNFQLRILADTGHVPSYEQPDEFNKAIISFLE